MCTITFTLLIKCCCLSAAIDVTTSKRSSGHTAALATAELRHLYVTEEGLCR